MLHPPRPPKKPGRPVESTTIITAFTVALLVLLAQWLVWSVQLASGPVALVMSLCPPLAAVVTALLVRRGSPRDVATGEDAQEKDGLSRAIQMDKLATAGMLVAGIGHELKTPLSFTRTNVGLLSELLSDGEPLDHHEVNEILADVHLGLERMTAIVSALGGMKRSRARREMFDLRTSLETSLVLCRPMLTATCTIHDDLPAGLMACGDSGELSQVILNLLLNASHAIEDTGRRGELRLRGGVWGDHVWLEVEDNGVGITDEAQGRLFEPFYTTKSHERGTGLGLTVARTLVEGMRGRLTCDSAAGRTVFRLTLPSARAERVEHSAAA